MSILHSVIRNITKSTLNCAIKQIKPANHLRNSISLLTQTRTNSSKVSGKNRSVLKNEGKTLYNDMIDYDDEDGIEEFETEVYEREFVDMKVEDFESLYKDDVSLKDLIETILKEYEFTKYNSVGRVPSVIEAVDMDRLIKEGPTPTKREQMFNYFFKREMVKRNAALRKKRDKAARLVVRSEKNKILAEKHGSQRTGLLDDDGDIIYGLWHNSLFCRIPENTMKSRTTAPRLVNAALWGRKLVFDFGFADHMEGWIERNTMDQIQDSYGLNRYTYEEPYDIWFCNFDKNNAGAKYLMSKPMKNLYDGSMITIKEDCFTNHFDKSKLVYLSPNAKERLTEIKEDDVLIVGVYNDKGSVKPLTYRKASQLGIRCKSLPLDSYLAWHGGSKSLCINHVVGILLEIKANGGNWRDALMKHIPTRKIKPVELIVEEEARRRAKYAKKLPPKFNIRKDLDCF